MQFRRDLLGVRFVSDDGRLAFTIVEALDHHHVRFSLEVTVECVQSGTRPLTNRPAAWTPREDPEAEAARARLDQVVVELGPPDFGETWSLAFARPTRHRSRCNGYDWVPLTEHSPIDEIAVFPEFGGSPFGDMRWDWRDGWWYPYSTFRASCPNDGT